MQELAGQTPAQLLDLSAELKLAKATMDDVESLYDLTKAAYELADPESEAKGKLLQQCISVGALVREVAEEVGGVAGRAAGAMMAARHFVGVQNIAMLVAQMTYIVSDEVRDPDTVRRIAERLSEVQIENNNGPQGTAITPDVEARLMDDTVPRIAREDEDAA